ncbi:hypothetical protein [Spirosoma gilvum]
MEELEFIISSRTIHLGDTGDRDFLAFIQKKIEGIEIYEMKIQPGVIYASAKQWKVVGNVNSLVSILAAALSFYLALKPDAPKEKDPKPQIIVKIDNAGQNNVYRIGTDIKNEEELISHLRDSINLLKTQLELQQTKSKLDSIRHSPHWQRIH